MGSEEVCRRQVRWGTVWTAGRWGSEDGVWTAGWVRWLSEDGVWTAGWVRGGTVCGRRSVDAYMDAVGVRGLDGA